MAELTESGRSFFCLFSLYTIMAKNYDAIIIGGRAQRPGRRRLPRQGRAARCSSWNAARCSAACCVTEEVWPGFKVSTAAYVNSLLRPEIIRDLELKKHGFEMLPRSPSSFTPFPDGRYLMMGPDTEMTHARGRQVLAEGRRGATRSTRRC